ncbi:MAG: 3-phosphoshikimate 1-carboxyvinyltransferase [Gammaproteobacteria bacterium]|nr:3-phosphoshikimate 1-carboxyvinyltransferase [Gammaproteobacteria bacterium]
MQMICQKSQLTGNITIPPSKSHTMRSILFASMASGKSVISNYLHSPDTNAMIKACEQFGASITVLDKYQLAINGVDGHPSLPDDVIDVGNSGQVLRFVGALSALCDGYVVLTGDKSIRHNRPLGPLIDGLKQLGAFCVSTKNDGFAPCIINGPIAPGKVRIDGKDSQPVSGLIIAASFLSGITEIEVINAGERPFIDLTLYYLDLIGANYYRRGYEYFKVCGPAQYDKFNYTIPGDFSSALFPIVAALITQSEIIVNGIDMDDVQGDKKVIEILQSMGANIVYHKNKKQLAIKKTTKLMGRVIDVNDFIDAVPILAVVGCFADGETVIKNATVARQKECDRISAITNELKKMGADINEFSDGLRVKKSRLTGAEVQSYQDHRIIMALSIAAMVADGETIIKGTQSIAKSYPSFCEDMRNLGANIKLK